MEATINGLCKAIVRPKIDQQKRAEACWEASPGVRNTVENTSTPPAAPAQMCSMETPVPTPAPVAPMVAPTAAPVAPAPTYTLQQIGAAGAALIQSNPAKRDELTALLQQYGVQSVAALKPEQLGAFATALRGLGANI